MEKDKAKQLAGAENKGVKRQKKNPLDCGVYDFVSFARWQITSTEKLKARAKATPCQNDCSFTKAIIIITKQKTLTITVKAFLSVKYCFMFEIVTNGFIHEGQTNIASTSRNPGTSSAKSENPSANR